MNGVITKIVLTAIVFQVLIGQKETTVSGYSYNNWNQQPVQWNYPPTNVHQQQRQPQKQNNGSKGDNPREEHIGRWALESGCWWTGCQSKLHRYACPAATYKHDSVDCATLPGHVDVKCCRQPPRMNVTQTTVVYTKPLKAAGSTTTTTTSMREDTITFITTPKINPSTIMTITTTPTTTTTTTPETKIPTSTPEATTKTTTTITAAAPTTTNTTIAAPDAPPPSYNNYSKEDALRHLEMLKQYILRQ